MQAIQHHADAARRSARQTAAVEVGLALSVAAVAGFFRLHQLSSAPPGLYGDEAANGLDILFTIPQSHPIFFEVNNGREPLFIYLQALAVALLGPSILALRLTAAVVGIATTLTTYWVGRELLGRRVGFLAALGLATSFWHADLSRIGLRAIAAPLLLTLALVLFWRGIRRGSAAMLGLAGLGVSLGLYNYISGRFVPLLLAGILVWELVVFGRSLIRRWPGLLACCLVAAVATAPLALYFVQHPEHLTLRSAQVSVFNPSPTIEARPATFTENLQRNLGMFFVRGDVNPRHNLPGRPVLTPVGAPWLALGLALAAFGAGRAALRRSGAAPFAPRRSARGSAVALGIHRTAGSEEVRTGVGDDAGEAIGARSYPHPAARSPNGHGSLQMGSVTMSLSADSDGRAEREARDVAGGWLLLYAAVGLLPGLLTHESPNFLRLTILAPAVYLLWGWGLARAAEWAAGLARRVWRRESIGRALGVALALGVVGYEATDTYRDYFLDWAHRADVYQTFDSGLVPVAGLVEEAAAAGLPAYLYVDYHRFRAVHYLSPAGRTARWLQGYSDLLLLPSPQAGAEGALLVLGDFQYGADLERRYLGGLHPDWVERDPAGSVVFSAYRLSRSQIDALRQPATRTRLGQRYGAVELLGGSLDREAARPGERLGITLVWRQLADWTGVYSPYLHVVDDRGHGWGQDDRIGFPVEGWKEGDLFLSRHEWLVPVDAPPLEYKLEVGMATRPLGWPPGPSTALGPPVELGRARLDRTATVGLQGSAATVSPKTAQPSGADLGGLTLVGFDGSLGPLKPGDRLTIDLVWQASQAPMRDLLVDLSLIDPSGRIWAAERSRPAYGSYSTAEWPAGTVLRDPRTLTLAGDAPEGTLRLVVRTRDAASGQELGRADLGGVPVVAPPRSFELPKMQRPLDADFGGEVALRGFDLDVATLRPGGAARLTLYWQALASPTKNYTVFTHLLDARDRVVAQQDNQPARGQMPTLGWAPGQVVKDEYELKLGAEPTSAEVVVEVGLYDAATGERLRVAGSGEDRLILARLPVREDTR